MSPCPPPRSSVAAWPLQPSAPPPAPPAIARRTTPPPRRWRSCPGSLSCRRASPAPGRAWTGRAWRVGTRRSSPCCCRPRAALAPPPAPAAAPPRSSAAARLQPAPPLPPAPQATARRAAPPPRWWRSCPGSPACHRASPAPPPAPPPAPAAAPPCSSATAPLQPSPLPPAPPATARCTAPPPRRWRSCPGACSCHRATPSPYRAWTCQACGSRRSSPSCSRPRAALAPPPAPALSTSEIANAARQEYLAVFRGPRQHARQVAVWALCTNPGRIEYRSVFNTSAANTTRLVPQRDGLRSEAAEEGEQRRQRRPKPEEPEGGPPAILLPQPTDETLGDGVGVG
eukprot:scaffold28651_cov61-Phaeocystis_antarctica.AAC.2